MTLAASLGSSTQGPVHKMPSNATLGAEDDNVTWVWFSLEQRFWADNVALTRQRKKRGITESDTGGSWICWMKLELNLVCSHDYWLTQLQPLMGNLETIADVLDEFQASSKELEDELERELADTEKQQAELKEKIKRLEAEKEDWKVSSGLVAYLDDPS